MIIWYYLMCCNFENSTSWQSWLPHYFALIPPFSLVCSLLHVILVTMSSLSVWMAFSTGCPRVQVFEEPQAFLGNAPLEIHSEDWGEPPGNLSYWYIRQFISQAYIAREHGRLQHSYQRSCTNQSSHWTTSVVPVLSTLVLHATWQLDCVGHFATKIKEV